MHQLRLAENRPVAAEAPYMGCMATFDTQHPRDSNSKRFVDKTHSAFEGNLPAAGWTTINDRFPEPQANVLEKVASVVDAVAAGANTNEAIAECLDVTPREGAYYASAAGYLGLIDTATGEELSVYDLTASGECLLDTGVSERAELMKSAAAQAPGVETFVALGRDALEDYLGESGLDGTTIGRRAATIESWSKALASDQFAAVMARESSASASRSVAAAQHAADARSARVSRNAEPDVRCPSCGNQVPLSGICDWC